MEDHLTEFETKLIEDGFRAVEKCVKEHRDWDSALVLLAFIKAIGGDLVEISLESDEPN